MSMNFSRYSHIRSRLIELYNLLNNKVYQVWIAPEKLMSLDQLRGRTNYRSSEIDDGDNDYFASKQMRGYKIPRIIDILPNLSSYKDISFQKPTANIVEVYEAIQEWISLWCDIMRNLPDMKHPPLGELRVLENFAYLIFPEYKRMKPYLIKVSNSQVAREAELANNKGLATLASLFGMNSAMSGSYRSQAISWYSHLDALIPDHAGYASSYDPGSMLQVSDGFSTLGLDSLSHMDSPVTQNNNWLFTAG